MPMQSPITWPIITITIIRQVFFKSSALIILLFGNSFFSIFYELIGSDFFKTIDVERPVTRPPSRRSLHVVFPHRVPRYYSPRAKAMVVPVTCDPSSKGPPSSFMKLQKVVTSSLRGTRELQRVRVERSVVMVKRFVTFLIL